MIMTWLKKRARSLGKDRVPEPMRSSVEKAAQEKSFKITGNKAQNKVVMGTGLTVKGDSEVKFWREAQGNEVIIGQEVSADRFKIAFKGNNNKLIIGDHVRWTGYILIVGSNRTVKIGSRSTAQGVYILCRDKDVTIGSDCMFSREIEVRWSTDVHKVYDLDSGKRINLPRAVNIGDSVWVAAKVTVSKGVSIPDGCVVGAGSFVNKPFDEQNAVIAGTPAKIVKSNIRWER